MKEDRLRELFIEEAQEHLKEIESIISVPRIDEKGLSEAYRHAHSLKGMCATVGLNNAVERIHKIEEHLSSLSTFYEKKDEILKLYREIKSFIDTYIEKGWVGESNNVQYEQSTEYKGDFSGTGRFRVDIYLSSSLPMPAATVFKLLRNIEREFKIVKSNADKDLLKKGEYPNPFSLVVEGDISKIQSILAGEGGIVGINIIPTDSEESKPSLGESVRVSIKDLDKLVENMTRLFNLKEKIKTVLGPEDDLAFKLDILVERMYNQLLDIRMVPLKVLENGLREMLRAYSKDLGKKVTITIEDRGVLIDRAIVDKMYSILVHIIKNAVYHGIESPDERVKKGKSPSGIIKIEAEDFPDAFQISIYDDGRGVDIEKIKKRIVERGIANIEDIENYSDEEILQFLFHPGVTTSGSENIIAGRGIGLDAVKEMVQRLYGFIYVESEKDRGTIFRIKIPRSAILQHVVIVATEGEKVAFPSYMVEAIVTTDESGKVSYRGNEIRLKGRPTETVLIFESRGSYLGYYVDEVDEIDMVLVREIPPALRSIPYIYGYFFKEGSPTFLLHPGILWNYFS